jgi:hypothetical protein
MPTSGGLKMDGGRIDRRGRIRETRGCPSDPQAEQDDTAAPLVNHKLPNLPAVDRGAPRARW